MRLRRIKNASEKIMLYPNLVVFNPSFYSGQWKTVFKNDNPIHIEIGMGKGKFLLEKALTQSNINFIGIEKSDSVVIRAVQKIDSHHIANLRVVNIDASTLNEVFRTGEVEKIFLNFSDPWPKGRQEKRRLTSDSFLTVYRNILSKQGSIEIKTDNPGFFEYTLMNLSKNKMMITDVSVDLHRRQDKVITTEYEEKFISLGQPIYFIESKFGSE